MQRKGTPRTTSPYHKVMPPPSSMHTAAHFDELVKATRLSLRHQTLANPSSMRARTSKEYLDKIRTCQPNWPARNASVSAGADGALGVASSAGNAGDRSDRAAVCPVPTTQAASARSVTCVMFKRTRRSPHHARSSRRALIQRQARSGLARGPVASGFRIRGLARGRATVRAVRQGTQTVSMRSSKPSNALEHIFG